LALASEEELDRLRARYPDWVGLTANAVFATPPMTFEAPNQVYSYLVWNLRLTITARDVDAVVYDWPFGLTVEEGHGLSISFDPSGLKLVKPHREGGQ